MGITLLLKKAGAVCAAFSMLSLTAHCEVPAETSEDWFSRIEFEYQSQQGDTEEDGLPAEFYDDQVSPDVGEPLPAPPVLPADHPGTSEEGPDNWQDDDKEQHEDETGGPDSGKAIPGLEYTYSSADGGIVITKYTGTAKELAIPSMLDGQPVRRIADQAFEGHMGLNSLFLPGSLRHIGERALQNCHNLMDLSISEGVTSIGRSAFSSCSRLVSLVLPQSITSIGSWAFGECHYLKEIVLPPGITAIPDEMFSMCMRLEALVIPDKVVSIGRNAFYYCHGLKDITIPASVRDIAHNAFFLCDQIFTFHVAADSYAQQYAYESHRLLPCVVIRPGAAIKKGEFDFYVQRDGCAVITQYTGKADDLAVPAILGGYLVKYIEDKAFYGCGSLRTVTLPDWVVLLGDSVFENCANLADITLPAGLHDIGERTFADCPLLESVLLAEELTGIPSGMFISCKSLQIITLPDKVKSIGSWAFSGCGNLKQVTIPPGVNDIADSAFTLCPQVKLKVTQGSYAHDHAVSHSIPFSFIPFE